MNNIVRIAGLSDSPKLHTGFGTVVEQIYKGFHDAGYQLHVLGFMDSEPDYEHKLPYYFSECNPFDELARKTYRLFLKKVKPDIIFIMTDPGNLVHYVDGIVHDGSATYLRNGRDFVPPIVAYTPIEGLPLMSLHKQGFEGVFETNGELVVYNQTAKNNIERMGWTEIAEKVHVIGHGLDHANFSRYTDKERKVIRQLVGLDDYFVIGNVGSNKRTKGIVELIYTARILRDMGENRGIKFYCHTNPYIPTMMGYQLDEIVKYYGVEDMFLWRQQLQSNYWLGSQRNNGSVADLMDLEGKIPDSPEKRGLLFAKLDFVSMLNCLDMYVDLSQNDGWNLPLGEAMACGVPCLSVYDHDVRAEIYDGGVRWIKPLPQDVWGTLHTGARLVTVDPHVVAREIIKVKSSDSLLADLAAKGQKVASKYKWDDTRQKFVEIVNRVAEFVFEEDVAYA